jgi:hypothetical protein
MKKYKQYAKNIYSQCGEDGIIEKVFQELDIKSGWCVEFGASDGFFFSNTYNLWKTKKFNALLIEANKDRYQELSNNIVEFPNVIGKHITVSYDENSPNSLDNIISATNIDINENNYSLLSIDIDSADYYILKSINKYFPKVIICETNNAHEGEYITYDGGCSLLSLTKLANDKGYELIEHTGNAIFVRKDLFGLLNMVDNSVETIGVNIEETNRFYQGLFFRNGRWTSKPE